MISRVRVPDLHYEAIAELVVTLGIASHRADITVLECAKASAARTAGGERIPFDEPVAETVQRD